MFFKRRGYHCCKGCQNYSSFLFSKDDIFDGDLSLWKQKSSVESFLYLLSPIINGDTGSENLSGQAKRVAMNLAELTWSNSAKYKRQSVEHLGSSLSNEPLLSVKIRLLIHSKTRKNVSWKACGGGSLHKF